MVLLVNFVVASYRIVRGNSSSDRLITLLLLSTTGAAVLGVLAELMDMPALRDAALAVVALSSLIVVVWTVGRRQQS
ncbi:multicomponent Na+:H+ antiporter subunit F [Rhodococcus triatomae]|uniref:Multicomponent Na+:H+ antiporter subunit F n=1 Tax=Rhodococcus triatomae TaxID=300028 RepID=A0A1G8ABU5_9NOCA|nr:hypothetical protein [Rhodococcus triatomae]SDH18422.1 multicomponent Na+:H+ antiporter subunit F [Rhodococcus triatomae]